MKYGKSETDVLLEKKIQCREIVREILDFGVTEGQKKIIIELLSLELEDRDMMVKISTLLKAEGKKDTIRIIDID